MSEINNDEVKFDIRNRSFKWNKDDYKDNKKEEFLFKYLTHQYYKNSFNMRLLDREEGTRNVITSKDIQIFLSDKKVQKKNITEEDVINFLNKMMKLNPTKEEKALDETYTNYHDENGKTIMSKELQEMFGFEKNITHINNKAADENGNVQAGFEIFDLNNDGKIDKIEKDFINDNSLDYANIETLNGVFLNMDKAGSDNNNQTDGVISAADKQKIYNQQKDKYNQKRHNQLDNIQIKNDSGENIVSSDIKSLYSDGKMEISTNDLTDANGVLKNEYKVFDLNNDGRLDEMEKQFFSGGGRPFKGNGETVTIENFMNALNQIDKYGYAASYGSAHEDNLIKESDKENLYKIIAGAYNMAENITELSPELQAQYIDALNNVDFAQHTTKHSTGAQSGNKISIALRGLSQDDVSSVLIHELTHYILSKVSDMDALTQEVETFYMEYKLYKEIRNKPDFYRNFDNGSDVFRQNEHYRHIIDEYKRKYPDMSERDIAIAAFLKDHYLSYNGRAGYATKTEEEMKSAFYYPLGNIFIDKNSKTKDI